MSFCDQLPGDTPKPDPKQNLQEELIWGLTYRNFKEQEKNKPIRPLRSPIDIPFKLCRAELLNKRKEKRKVGKEEDMILKDIQEGGEPIEIGAEKVPLAKTKSKKRKREPIEKPSLLERSVMSQSRYMDFLSQPNPKFYEEPKQKRWKKRCELEPCPPRFVQLAVPNRRRVFANWKEFCDSLPAEMLKRYDDILHTDQNLEPREARYHFKKLDREKRKKLREKKRLEKKKKLQREDPAWQKEEIEALANAILKYLKDEPLFAVNYKQLLLSMGITDRVSHIQMEKKKKPEYFQRNARDHFERTVVEMADKSAIWMDTLTRFVDMQPVESEVDIPPVSVASLEEEEGVSSYEGESEIEGGSSEGEEGGPGFGQLGEEDELDIIKDSEAIINDLFKVEEGEDEADLDEFIGDLTEDQLEKLIQILSNCSDEFLAREVDAEKMPGVRYQDILQKLKDLRDGMSLEDRRKKPFLEQVITDWALQNDPDKVDQKLLNKIREVAELIQGLLLFPGAGGDEVLIGQEGEEGEGGEIQQEEGGVGPTEGEGPEGELVELDEGEEGGITAGEGGDDEKRGTQDLGFAPEEAGEGTTEDEVGEIATEAEGGAAITEEPDEEVVIEGPGGEAVIEGPIGGDGEDQDLGITYLEEEEDEEEGVEGTTGPLEIDLGEEGGVTLDLGLEGEEEGEGEFIPEEEGGQPPIEGEETEEEKELLGEGEGLEGIIKGHKPPKTFEHSPDTVCCLSLKTWAVWLLEITHNAHNWTKWMVGVIAQVREYAATVRGDVKNTDGTIKTLKKSEWRKFCKETEENVVAWRQYSAHVKELSSSIMENFHGKRVNCCPKCLQDHLIRNVVHAHETLRSLTEAIDCAAYWQRTLDGLVGRLDEFSDLGQEQPIEDESSSSSYEVILEEVIESDDEDEVVDIEGTDLEPSPQKEPPTEPSTSGRKASTDSKDLKKGGRKAGGKAGKKKK